MRVLGIARDFADGSSEPWSFGVAAANWEAYVRDMLAGAKPANRAVAVACRLRFHGGQLVVLRPRILPPCAVEVA